MRQPQPYSRAPSTRQPMKHKAERPLACRLLQSQCALAYAPHRLSRWNGWCAGGFRLRMAMVFRYEPAPCQVFTRRQVLTRRQVFTNCQPKGQATSRLKRNSPLQGSQQLRVCRLFAPNSTSEVMILEPRHICASPSKGVAQRHEFEPCCPICAFSRSHAGPTAPGRHGTNRQALMRST